MSTDSSNGCDTVATSNDHKTDTVSDESRQEKSSISDDVIGHADLIDEQDERATSANATEDDRPLSSIVVDELLLTPASSKKETPKVMLTPDGAIKETDDSGFVYYKCRFCGLTFNYMTTLKAHERVHDVEEPYVCPKCNCTFHYNCELEYHMQQHSGKQVSFVYKI